MNWRRFFRPRPKIALYWCSGCGGCEESVFDLAEALPDLPRKTSLVFWPAALDFRVADLEALPDRSIAAAFINGAVRTDDHVRMARLLRSKSRRVIAHGACAHLGGVLGLANLADFDTLLRTAFIDAPTVKNPECILPTTRSEIDGEFVRLPRLEPRLRALDQVIAVDHYIPGCPPTPEMMRTALTAAIEGTLSKMPAVFADEQALCRSCPRRETRSETVRIRRFRRLYEQLWDPERCFLDQGLVCLGPATRGGCGARCIAANMPCRGCFGPPGNDKDPGAAVLSLLASVMGGENENEIREAARTLPDPAGLIYRYGMAVSVVMGGKGNDPSDSH